MELSGSQDTLFVVLELHDERLDVLASTLPLVDALLSVGVEVLLLLVDEGLCLHGGHLLLLELSHYGFVLDLSLVLLEVLQFESTHPFLFLLLLFSQLKLFVADLPEFGELLLFLLNGHLLGLLALELELTRALNGGFHLSLAGLLSFKKTVGAVLSLSNLSVKNLLLVVL